MKDNWVIYCHLNKINGKRYIGQTKCSLKDRRRDGKGYVECTLFYKAIQKYGWNNFEHIILKDNISSIEEANKLETFYIKYYHTFVDDPACNGYNLTMGGDGRIVSELTKQHMSEAQRCYFQTHKVSEERKKKLSISLKNFYSTEEGKKAASEMRKKAWQNEEYRKYHSEIAKGGNNPAARKVYCLEEPGIIFNTVSEASMWCNNDSPSLRSHIAAQIQGKRKSCGKHPITKEKLHWRYVDND